MNKKLLKSILFTFLMILVIISTFILFAGQDKINPDNISQKNNSYLSLRYYILTNYFRTIYPEYNLEKIPILKFDFNQQDVNHISKVNNIVNPLPKNFDHYNKINKWRENNLFYRGKNYKIKWKSHGRNPDGQDYRGLRSLNIKIIDGQKINNTDHFRLIIYRRFSSDLKIIEYLANEFNLITRNHKLVKVKIKGFEERLFWFEKRYNNEFTRNNNKGEKIIFSEPNNKSHIIRNKNDMVANDIFIRNHIKNKRFSQRISDSIVKIYNNFNNSLVNLENDNILKFLDTNYISSFLAARLISGCDYHGTLEKNLHIYFDTVNFKFYPCFGRDEIFSIVKADSIEHYLDGDSKLISTLLMNNTIRQKTYKKLYNFIISKKYFFRDKVYEIIDQHEKRHFPDWVYTTNGLTHLHTLPFIDHNLNTIFDYIKISNPIISFSCNKKKIIFNFIPNSNSGLCFDSFVLENLSQNKRYNVTISKSNYENIIESKELFSSEFGALNLSPILANKDFHNDLDTNLIQKEVCFYFIIETFNDEFDSLSLKFHLKNTITQELINLNVRHL